MEFLSTIDFINQSYQKERLGAAARNWTTTPAAKKDCADALETNIGSLALPCFNRYLHSFGNGELPCDQCRSKAEDQSIDPQFC